MHWLMGFMWCKFIPLINEPNFVKISQLIWDLLWNNHTDMQFIEQLIWNLIQITVMVSAIYL